jgi:hypothetical protein
MSHKLERSELLLALERLGALCPRDTEIVLAGGAALILGGYIERGTDDGDVIHSEPKLTDIRDLIAAVAEEQSLGSGWLNDGVKVWADVLPADFNCRLEEVGAFGNLRVRRLGRLDLLVMKFFAHRVGDLDDLEELAPTQEEVEFVRAQLPCIAELYPDRAYRMQLYLDQGESLHRTTEQQEEPGRGRGNGRGM